MPVYADTFLFQKMSKIPGFAGDYIHNNPVVAAYCKHPEDYWYSSAAFYLKGAVNFDFLKHIDERFESTRAGVQTERAK